MIVSILLWNTEGNKNNLVTLLEEAEYDILCIQEPWIEKRTKSTYCPRGSKYHLIHVPGGKAAIFVRKRFAVSGWEYEATGEWCRLWFGVANAEVGWRYGPYTTPPVTSQYPPR